MKLRDGDLRTIIIGLRLEAEARSAAYRTEIARLEGELGDLAALVVRLARSLKKHSPDNSLPGTAMDYLSSNKLLGSPLRG